MVIVHLVVSSVEHEVWWVVTGRISTCRLILRVGWTMYYEGREGVNVSVGRVAS